ncbi:MAG: hypothetical protein K6A73_00845 [Bacteroidales bacterium]|nr:hypothetical protein [Bacteroidales bacterium]
MTNDGYISITDNVCYMPEVNAVLMETVEDRFSETNVYTRPIDKYRVPDWGPENLLPQKVLDLIDKAEIVGTNADFNWKVGYGLGPKLVRVIRDPKNNRVVDYYEITEGKEFEWFERNDIALYLMETLTDLSYFANAFPIMVFDHKFESIEWLRHREAAFSRWNVNEKGEIISMLYSSKWDKSDKDIIEYPCIDEYNALVDLQAVKAVPRKKKRALCFPVYMPSPGRPYYSYPSWYSIFRSGWYSNIVSIPALKKAILKYKLNVTKIIYISPKYFDAKAKQMAIDPDDTKAKQKMREDLITAINDKLSGDSNAGKSITSIKELIPSGSSAIEEKYITIENVKNDLDGGEYLADYETGANVISYAMGVHPSLVGATPGKNSNSLSGSNIREIFLMKQALTFPMVDRAMRPLSVIRKFNNWDKDITVAVPEYVFTTLDQNKSGKQESTNAFAK